MKGLAASTLNEGLPAREFKAILSQIANNRVEITATARSIYQELTLGETQVRLYALSWPFLSPENTPEWMLMLVLCPAPTRSGLTPPLPQGIRLRVSDKTGISVQRTQNQNSVDNYLCVLIAGSWNEKFQATITLANGVSLTLPDFGFRP